MPLPIADRPARLGARVTGHSGLRGYRVLPAVAAIGAIAIGALALVGWASGQLDLARGMPNSGITAPNGAACVILLGLALWLLRPHDGGAVGGRTSTILGRVCAAAACLLALLVGVEWITGRDLGLDHVLFAGTVDMAARTGMIGTRGRMAGNTTVTVLLLGTVLLLLDAPALTGGRLVARAGRFVRWLSTVVAVLVPYFAVVGYLFGVRWLYNPSGLFAGMALETACALTLVAVGTALARPARGVARLLTGDDAGALLLRRALPVTVVVPIVFGWVRVRAEDLGFVTPRVGVAALVLAFTVVMVTTLTRAGAAAHRLAADRGRILVEREAARQALGRTEAEFREMVDNLPQLAWIADAAGTIVWYNRRWYDYTGTTAEQMQGEGRWAAYHPDHRARVVAGFGAAVESGTAWEDTFPLRAATGEWRWFLSRATPIRAAGTSEGNATGGPVVRWFGTNTDVTAQRALEAERERLLVAERHARADAERASAEAAAASRAKSQFLATMSHELRTPLNAISGHVQLVELGLHGPVTDAQRDALQRAQRAQRHLLGLINDVLNLARIEAGRVDYHMREIVMAELAHDVASLVEPQLAAKGITFTVDVPDGHALVAWADREKASQVLLNLLSNATKFTDAGGHVTLEGRAEEGHAGPAAVFRVRDTGRGIPLEDRARIFEPFVQLDTGYARQQEGTGLGLAISRDLARGMGGDLTLATTATDRGSVFAFALPRVIPSAPDVDRRTGEERRDGQRREAIDRRTGEERREESLVSDEVVDADGPPLARG